MQTEHLGTTVAYEAALKGIAWKTIRPRLVRYAFVCLRKTSMELAEDIAQDAIGQLYTHKKYKQWDPAACPDVFLHLAAAVRGLVSNHRQKHGTRYERSFDHEDLGRAAHAAGLAAFSAEDEYERKERAGVLLAQVRVRIPEEDNRCREVLDLLIEGVDSQKAQAEALGCAQLEIRNARRRLAGHLAVAQREIDEEPTDVQ